MVKQIQKRETPMKIERAIELSKSWIDGKQCTWFDDSYKAGFFRANAISEVEIQLVEQLWKTEQFVWELQDKIHPLPPSILAFIDKVEKRETERERVRAYWQEQYEKENNDTHTEAT